MKKKGTKNTQQRKPYPRFRSGYEQKVAASLKKMGIDFSFEGDVITYTIPESNHKYIPDFRIGSIFIEAKGAFDREARKKMKLVVEQNPDKDIRMLFMRNNRIAKNSKTTYAQWCEDRGIKYAISSVGEIPQEWVDDSIRTPE